MRDILLEMKSQIDFQRLERINSKNFRLGQKDAKQEENEELDHNYVVKQTLRRLNVVDPCLIRRSIEKVLAEN